MQKDVSVIIPCYNVENVIDRCWNSICAQTLGINRLEIIFIDDHSTDGTVEKLKFYEKQYPQSVCVILLSQNQKQGTARNIGISYATSPFIFFIDADDWIDSTALEQCYSEMLLQQPDLVVINAGRDMGDNSLLYKHLFLYPGDASRKQIISSIQERKSFLSHGTSLRTWGILYKKEFLTKNSIYFLENTYYEDLFFIYLVWFNMTSYIFLPDTYYHYFLNFNSTTGSGYTLEKITAQKDVVLHLINDLEKKGFGTNFAENLEFIFLREYFALTIHRLFLSKLPFKITKKIFLEIKEELFSRYPDFMNDPCLERLSPIDQLFVKEFSKCEEHEIGYLRHMYKSYF